MASRELLPLRRLVIELHKHGLFQTPLDTPFSVTRTSYLETTTVYEDNASCIVLAHSEGTKVRTKHISLKWHCFKDHLKNGDMKVVKIDLNLNWADIFTKPLAKLKQWNFTPFHYGMVTLFSFSLLLASSSHHTREDLCLDLQLKCDSFLRNFVTANLNLGHEGVLEDNGTDPYSGPARPQSPMLTSQPF